MWTVQGIDCKVRGRKGMYREAITGMSKKVSKHLITQIMRMTSKGFCLSYAGEELELLSIVEAANAIRHLRRLRP